MSENVLKIGFCPTMATIAQKIGQNNKNVALFPLGSAAEALYYVKNAALDGVVIGRKAKAAEISDSIWKLPLQMEGVTLVARQKGFIDYRNLNQIPIVTYLDEPTVKGLLSNPRHIQFVANFKEAIALLKGSNAALIHWKDYNDSLELLIPVDETGSKIIDFRLPTLYYQVSKNRFIQELDLDGLI